MRAARRQREGPARCVAVQAAFGVEHVEQREEIVFVGAAAVEEHERALRIPGGGPLQGDHRRGLGSGVSFGST